ncbi:hypothetical protein ASE88_17845 [Sphingomonas sp. Leaf38]|jgi:hypothetical protein|nr:hypothetical protein ASE88_17845 [Sphingomonas sp. Leaf38]
MLTHPVGVITWFHWDRIMRSIVKSSFFWQFSGGFVLGAIGLLALQPAEARQTFASHFEHSASTTR